MSLNPYYNGRYSTKSKGTKLYSPAFGVLSLIIMEDTLRVYDRILFWILLYKS